MMKKVLAVLLAVCLIVGAQPIGATAQESRSLPTGSQEELRGFLVQLGWIGQPCEYDAKNPRQVGGYPIHSLLAYLVNAPTWNCINWELYPERPGVVKYGYTPGGPDPLGKFKEGKVDGYCIFKRENVAWVLENIFNVSPADVAEMEKYFEEDNIENPSLGAYYYDGCYYAGIGGAGLVYAPVITKMVQQGNRTLVTYKAGIGDSYVDAFAIMELKEIGGGKYWTIHYNTALKEGQNPLATGGFNDVYEGDYFADAVTWAVEKGITNGTGNGKFSPSSNCTREQIVTFLWKAAGSPEPIFTENPFSDVSENSYARKAILWAVENNITSGTDEGKFSPGASCTRAQAVTFMWRAEGSPKAEGAVFDDVPANSYYKDAVAWAAANEITDGTGGGKFSPQNQCTRGQIVTFLYRDQGEYYGSNQPEMDIYKAELGTGIDGGGGLYDLDGDGVKELLMLKRVIRPHYNPTKTAFVYTVKDGAAEPLLTDFSMGTQSAWIYVAERQKEKYLLFREYYGGDAVGYNYWLYKLSDGKLTLCEKLEFFDSAYHGGPQYYRIKLTKDGVTTDMTKNEYDRWLEALSLQQISRL